MTDYISGIFNYCDRWCERCPFTARCRSFSLEQAIARRLNGENGDEANREFWKALEQFIPRHPEFEAILAEGLEADEDWSASLGRPELEEDEIDRAERDPLILLAFDYATQARRWLTRLDLRHVAREGSGCGTVDRNDALDVIEWYALQIAVKLTRAMSGQIALDDETAFATPPHDTRDGDDTGADDAPFVALWDEGDDEPWAGEISEGMRGAERSDRDGSAKVALIGIERSLGALTLLRGELPADEPTIRDLQRRLARLRLEIDRRWPGARTFVWPGFDEIDEGR